jgi:hypothetical protein
MPQHSLQSMRKQLHSERAHAQWLVKQKAMHKQLVRCQMRIAQLVAVLDVIHTSIPKEKRAARKPLFHKSI